jgi:hypothetical protein
MARFLNLATTLGMIGWCGAVAAGSVSIDGPQSSMDTRDVQGLQDDVDRLRGRLSLVAASDEAAAAQLRGDLDIIDDEIAYLRVTLRRDGNLPRDEYDRVAADVRALESRLRSILPATHAAAGTEVPVGTEIDVRLQTSLHSDTAQVEDRFTATTVADLFTAEHILIPAGSQLRGEVSAVDRSSRTDRTSSMTLTFDSITIRGQTHAAALTVTEAIERGGLRDEAGRVGIGAAVGGILGGILGGGKGVLTGVLIGAGGTIIATEGKDVELPAGTVLRARFDTAVILDAEPHEAPR